MNKKNLALIALVLALAAVYVIFFTDWFRSKPMVISHTTRPMGRGGRMLTLFSLGDDYELTEIKVVPLAEWETNKLAQPLWHVVGHSDDPVNHFVYGQGIDGMDPVVDGSRPLPLQMGVSYRIFITAGRLKGWHDFQSRPPGASPPAQRTNVTQGP
ncbi:MAG TPA: hypothetical protein VMH30_11050 [Verrucomicrobiae bacterium]|nr:hypothetical protein [Verrucomicrobiae bacterium]